MEKIVALASYSQKHHHDQALWAIPLGNHAGGGRNGCQPVAGYAQQKAEQTAVELGTAHLDSDVICSIIFPSGDFMSRADKRLQKMRQNPCDWRIEEILSVGRQPRY